MRYLILLVLLLLPAWGWAETPDCGIYIDEIEGVKIDGKDCIKLRGYTSTSKELEFKNTTTGPIATCDYNYRNCEIIEPSAFPCYQRMQEAMRLMNTVYYNTPMIDLPKTDLTRRLNAEWKSTMKDCVQ